MPPAPRPSPQTTDSYRKIVIDEPSVLPQNPCYAPLRGLIVVSPMNQSRKRQLKQLGKAEVARQSAELRAALKSANPATPGDDNWAENYKHGTVKERWLRKKLPLLHKQQVDDLFVVI